MHVYLSRANLRNPILKMLLKQKKFFKIHCPISSSKHIPESILIYLHIYVHAFITPHKYLISKEIVCK